MKGKVLDFNENEESGIITTDNGERYKFEIADWKAQSTPAKGQKVDFETNENNASEIYTEITGAASGISSKVIAALFAFFLGGLGAHKFYLGYNKQGVIMLLVAIFGWILLAIPTFIIGIIAIVEAILYLSKSDEDFQSIYIDGYKPWF